MKKIFIISMLLTAILTACVETSEKYKTLEAENDSLRIRITQRENEINSMLTTLNAIEEDIQTVRAAENYIDINKDKELNTSQQEQIKRNMSLIVETLKKNKQQLSELEEKLKSSNSKMTGLQKTIQRLTKEIDEKSQFIAKLQNDLNEKDTQIQELSDKVEDLNTDIEILEDVTKTQTETINRQEQSINTVFYCFGTKKELKEQNILTGGGLFSSTKALQDNFNKDYFIAVDKRSVTAIPLYASKAKICTNHPEGSYKFFKDNDRNLTLEITDADSFWSLSKYLVIEVK